MTQHRVEIKPGDVEGWKQWMDCLAQLNDELVALKIPEVQALLNKYEFRRCDYGMGVNIDWPEKQ